MTFFTADDFITNSSAPQTPHSVAELANQKLQREAKVVYGQVVYGEFLWNHTSEYGDTHRALLICVEEIVKPKCEHAGHIIAVGKGIFGCADCKSEIKPTGWEVVE